jgi:XTP/dITP diphosphohydrolase
MMRHRLLLATGNPGKLREFQALLGEQRWELVTPADAGIGDLEVVEDGETYQENAARKARAYANAARLPALADDSGLEVDALEGRPGVHSARYAGVGLTDEDAANRKKLLGALEGIPPQQRGARFRAFVALTHPYGPNVRFGEGTVEGRIAQDERGDLGFGYDPVFELPDGRRMAELSREEKNEFSHRARALAQLGWALDALHDALDNTVGQRTAMKETGSGNDESVDAGASDEPARPA